MNLKFIELKAEKDLCWSFSDGAAPYFSIPGDGYGYSRSVRVDPFPAYAHDMDLVGIEAVRVARSFPLKEPIRIVTLDREFLERTNGWTDIEPNYDSSEKPRPWAATIVLSGKRIPIHPAMTRYLVSHEYGPRGRWTFATHAWRSVRKPKPRIRRKQTVRGVSSVARDAR